MHGMESVK